MRKAFNCVGITASPEEHPDFNTLLTPKHSLHVPRQPTRMLLRSIERHPEAVWRAIVPTVLLATVNYT